MLRLSMVRPVLAVLTIGAALSAPARATDFARIFEDHMVLQRDRVVPIFGTDHPGQAVTVCFAGQTKQATTDPDGKWRVDLDSLTVNSIGQSLTATGSSTITATDVLVGEVWLAAGQSNMDWMVKQSTTSPHPEHYPLIRMANWTASVGASGGQVYGAEDYAKLTPDHYYTGHWQTLDANTVLPQSAVAYFFANALARELKNVPIGIVDISRGGTLAEAFIAPEILRADPTLRAAFEDPRGARTTGQWAANRITKNLTGYTHPDPTRPHPHPFAPGFLYPASIAHLIPFQFRGVIWYQGESNAEFTTGPYQWNGARLADYQYHVLHTLVTSWRTALDNPTLPFYQVQLPRIKASNRALWPWFREAQSRLAADLPGVEQAVVPEFGIDGSNVHPPNKEPVGERLAAIALDQLYHSSRPWSGPVLRSHQRSGHTIILHFDQAGRELTSTDRQALREFQIAGANRNFVPATAKIVGDSLHVSAPGIDSPLAVRYAWHMNIDVNFANADGLPASPFRTDHWLTAPGRPIRLACIGDSITEGMGVAKPSIDSYPSQLAKILGARFEVRNFGKSGYGAHRPIKKYGQTSEYKAALAFQPDLILCNLGINDITHWGSYSKESFLAEYSKLIDAFAASGRAPLIIIWHPLAPLFPGQPFHNSPNLDTLNAWIAEMAARTGVLTLDMHTPLSQHPEWFPDHIHPNEAGARAIAEQSAQFLRALEQAPPICPNLR